jgi:hypothetical protein
MATEYKTALPEERLIAEELDRTRRLLENRTAHRRAAHEEN